MLVQETMPCHHALTNRGAPVRRWILGPGRGTNELHVRARRRRAEPSSGLAPILDDVERGRLCYKKVIEIPRALLKDYMILPTLALSSQHG